MKHSDKARRAAHEHATSEEYLRSVMIGPREPFNSTIYLAAYDPGRVGFAAYSLS